MARPTLAAHWKFAELAAALNGRHIARGVLELIWDTAYASGDPYLGSSAAVEAIADWRGAKGELVAALVECRFLDVRLKDGRETYEVHDLEDHAPDYVVKRWERETERRAKGETVRSVRQKAAKASWVARATAKVVQSDANGGQLQDVCSHVLTNVSPPAPAPAPAPALTDLKYESKPGSEVVGAETPKTASSPPPSPAKPRVQKPPKPQEGTPIGEFAFPCDGEPKTWWLTQEQLTAWEASYPSLDVLASLRGALAYFRASPSKRKTFTGWPPRLTSWMNGDVNDGKHRRGGPNSGGARAGPSRDVRIGYGRAEEMNHKTEEEF